MKKYILWGLLLMPVGFMTHAMFTFSSLDKKTKDEFAVRQKEQADRMRVKEMEDITSYLKKLAGLAKKIPITPRAVEKSCPAGLPVPISYTPTDPDFFRRFASGSYVKGPEPKVWYRSEHLEVLNKNLSADKPEEWNTADMAKAVRSLDKTPYFLVFYPTGGLVWPVGNKDLKGFAPGYFDGWQVLVDASTGETLCQTALYATNSATITFRKFKLARIITVYDNFQKNIEEDLTDNFWKAVQQGLDKMKGIQ